MMRIFNLLHSGEKGLALPIVLGMLVIGALVIIPALGHTTTSLKSANIVNQGINGMYAADAGVENALWSLAHGTELPTQLSDNVNHMEVFIQTEEKGTYTLYFGELIEPGEHSDYLGVDGEIAWDDEAGFYKYTITVTWQPESGASKIHLEEVGARLPIDYIYETGSAFDFPENLSIYDPEETVDELGASLLRWELLPPLPYVSEEEPVRTQIFYIDGNGSQSGHYAWVVANREDIGAVGEITGTEYRITSTSINPENNMTTSKIVSDVIVAGGTIYIISWQNFN